MGTTQGVFIVDLASFAKSNKRFDYKYLRYKLDNPQSTQLEKINSILEDKNGTIWLGGNGSGLYQLTSDKNNHFVFKTIPHVTGCLIIQLSVWLKTGRETCG